MAKGRKTGGRVAGTPNKPIAERRSAKRRAALAANQLVAESNAAEALDLARKSLRAAISALNALSGPDFGPKTTIINERPNGKRAGPAAAPPSIRMIKTIVADEGVSLAEAKRIQEREIVARAEWRPPIRMVDRDAQDRRSPEGDTEQEDR